MNISKRFLARIYPILLFFKKFLSKRKPLDTTNDLNVFVENFKYKKKIVVFCSGPSAKKAIIDSENLYLTTNYGYKGALEQTAEFVLYLNDQFGINRALVHANDFTENQRFVFFFSGSEPHQAGFNHLKKYVHLLKGKEKLFFLNLPEYEQAHSNYSLFIDFYKERNLPVKIQNSGMFLLLFGYYLAHKHQLPMEIYGLDCGVGGVVYHNSDDIPGKSVYRNRVKANVKMYLDYFYKNQLDVKNYSNYYGNII